MKNLLKKILSKIKVLYNYIRIELNLNLNIPYHFLLKKPLAEKDKYIESYNKIKNIEYREIDNFEKKCGYFIDKGWLDNLALYTQVVIKSSQINYQHGRLLYSLLREYLTNHDKINILETGTARGFSAICMSKALIDSKKQGKIFTIDIIPHNQKIFWNCLQDSDGAVSRKELLKEWVLYTKNINFLNGRTHKVIKKINFDRINFAFLDAAHNFRSLKDEFDFVSKKQLKGDLILFDDVTKNEFDEVFNFVKTIEEKRNYSLSYINSSSSRSYAVAKKL